MQSAPVRPFRLEVEDSVLADLFHRLDRTRWPGELPGVGWEYGVPEGYLRELTEYWRSGYDWRAEEARLNRWPQYRTVIDGEDLHFAHIRSPEPGATPLLMVHGWPGSIVEFQQVVGPLTDPRAYGADPRDAFDVVLPSVPGFGLSGPTHSAGWEYRRVAQAFGVLMERLGHERFGTQGGDWGAAITRELGVQHADRVIGVHLNLVVGAQATEPPTAEELEHVGPEERGRWIASWRRTEEWDREQDGYGVVQSTRPQTLAYALTDSPVGQLAWIAEKFKEWTDSSDRPEDAVDRDQMLTNVMLYWLTGTAGSSARIYWERAHSRYPAPVRSMVPTAVAEFPADNQIPLPVKARRLNEIVRWTRFEGGGHFAAMERPDELVGDIRAFFRSLRPVGPSGSE